MPSDTARPILVPRNYIVTPTTKVNFVSTSSTNHISDTSEKFQRGHCHEASYIFAYTSKKYPRPDTALPQRGAAQITQSPHPSLQTSERLDSFSEVHEMPRGSSHAFKHRYSGSLAGTNGFLRERRSQNVAADDDFPQLAPVTAQHGGFREDSRVQGKASYDQEYLGKSKVRVESHLRPAVSVEETRDDDAQLEVEHLRKVRLPEPEPKAKPAQTSVKIGMQLKRWMVTSRIGAGSFGETFSAIEIPSWLLPMAITDQDGKCIVHNIDDVLTNVPLADRYEVCIKVEQENKNVLRMEALALKKVQSCPQVVRYLGSGCTAGIHFLVMERLGPNLAELRRRTPYGIFNLYTTLCVGISCLQALRGVHDHGLVHRDVKPSNFVVGLPGTPNYRTCFLIDFGLARRFCRSSGKIRRPRENAGFRGTSRYASIASHQHRELGRVDDIWSLLFMLVEFATGSLPWRKFKDKEAIGRCKMESIGPHLVRNLPREFQPFLAHLQTLEYDDEPDYELLLSLMNSALERRGYPDGKPVDWELEDSMQDEGDHVAMPSPGEHNSDVNVVLPALPKPQETLLHNGNGTGEQLYPQRPFSVPVGEGPSGEERHIVPHPVSTVVASEDAFIRPDLQSPSPRHGSVNEGQRNSALRLSEVDLGYRPGSGHSDALQGRHGMCIETPTTAFVPVAPSIMCGARSSVMFPLTTGENAMNGNLCEVAVAPAHGLKIRVTDPVSPPPAELGSSADVAVDGNEFSPREKDSVRISHPHMDERFNLFSENSSARERTPLPSKSTHTPLLGSTRAPTTVPSGANQTHELDAKEHTDSKASKEKLRCECSLM